MELATTTYSVVGRNVPCRGPRRAESMSRVVQRPQPRHRVAATASPATDVVMPFHPRVVGAQVAGEGAGDGGAGGGARGRPLDPCLLALLQTAAEWRCRLDRKSV